MTIAEQGDQELELIWQVDNGNSVFQSDLEDLRWTYENAYVESTAFFDDHGIWKMPVVWDEHGNVIYALQRKQWQAYCLTPLSPFPVRPQPKYIGYGGAAGGGKSFLARVVAVAAALLWPGCTVIIFRETKDAVEENHVTKLFDELPEWMVTGWNGQKLVAQLHNGSRIRFGFLAKEADLRKYKGQEYDLMVFEEATQFAWSWVEWLLGNRLRSSVEGTVPFALFPSNPGEIGHYWFKRLFIERRYNPEKKEIPQEHAFIQSYLKDNQELNRRDPGYASKLERLAEPHRSWLRDGDWKAGAGTALAELDRRMHLIKPFDLPVHWKLFGAFDWGFGHPWRFGYYAVTEDGMLFKIDTIGGQYMPPRDIVDRITESMAERGFQPSELMYVAAGIDTFADKGKSIGVPGQTIAEHFQTIGFYLVPADVRRIHGLTTLREYLAWQTKGPFAPDPRDPSRQVRLAGDPFLRFFDTPGNRRCFEVLENMVTDPDNIEDVLKVNADAMGQGGDDDYDETRYATASRPPRADSIGMDVQIGAWDPATLAHESEKKRRGKFTGRRDDRPVDDSFGEF